MRGEITNAVKSYVRRFHEGTYDQSAALEAIDCAIADATRAELALANHTGWLQAVRRRRELEVANGEWPPGEPRPDGGGS